MLYARVAKSFSASAQSGSSMEQWKRMRCVDCIVEENKMLRAAEAKQIAIQRACFLSCMSCD